MGNESSVSKQQQNNDSAATETSTTTSKFTEDDVIDIELIDKGDYYLIPSDLDPDKDETVIKIVAISDTHSKHSQIAHLPPADILVHGGDFTNTGSLRDVQNYDKWIQQLLTKRKSYKYAVLIAGNHDITLEADYYAEVGCKRFHHGKQQDFKECIRIAENGNNVYLLDKSVELMGVSFYGSPYQPEFCQWAFNMTRGEQLRKEWAKIPDQGVDVLITHGPPKFHGDKVIPRYASLNASQWVGCDDLLQRVSEIKDVKFHVFGHIHEGYGVTKNEKIDGVTFINASSVDVGYRCVNKPIMFYVKGRGRQYCDVKTVLQEADDAKDNDDNDNAEEDELEVEENPYQISEDYEAPNDPSNEIEAAVADNTGDDQDQPQ